MKYDIRTVSENICRTQEIQSLREKRFLGEKLYKRQVLKKRDQQRDISRDIH